MVGDIPGAFSHKVPEASLQWQHLGHGILDSLAVGFAAVDASGRQIIVNRALAEMTGYTEEELLGQLPPFKYWAEENLPRITAAFQATLDGRPDTWEFLFKRKDGQRFNALITVRALPGSGQPDIMIATVEDITARRRAEAADAEHRRRLEALRQVGQAVGQSLDLKAVAALALGSALEVLDMEAGAIGYLDGTTQEIALLADRGLPPRMAQEIRDSPRLKFSQGAPGIVARSGELLIIEDVAHDPRTVLPATRESGFVFQGSLPLKFQGRVVGVLSAWSRRQHVFGPEDIELMSSIGNIVGVAIANARLFRQVERGKQEWEATFDAMSEGISIHAPDCRILRANKALARLLNTTPQALVGLPCYRVMHGQDEPVAGCPLLECLRTKAPTVLERQEPHLGDRWLRIACDPLFASSEEVAAVIHVVRDITRQKEQEAAERQRAQELEALTNIARILVQPGSFEERATQALEELSRVSGAERVTLRLPDETGQNLRLVATNSRAMELPPPLLVPNDQGNLSAVAFQQGQPLIVDDYQNHPLAVPHGFAAGLTSAAFLPIRAGGQVRAVVSLSSPQPNLFNPDRVRLLAAIADGIGALLENARLQEAERLRSQQRAAINRIARAISTSLDMEQIYATLAAELGQAMSYDRLSIALLTPEGDALNILQPGESAFQMPQRQELKNHVLEPIIKSGKPHIRRDLAQEAASLTSELLLQMGLRCAVTLPLTAKGKVLGTLNVFSREVGRYSETDLEFLQPIAGHLALALDNARLHQEISAELEDSRRRLEAFQAAARQLVLEEDLDRALQHLVDSARDLAGASYGSLDLWNPEGQRDKVFVSGLPPDAAQQDATDRLLTNQLSARDVISAPIIAKGHASGVLYVLRKQAAADFSPDDQRLLDLFAVLAGVLLENIGLYNEVTRERQTLAAIQSSMAEGLAVLDAAGKMVYFNEAAAAMTGWAREEVQNHSIEEVRLKAMDLVEPAAAVDALMAALGASAQGPATVDVTVLRKPERRELKVTAFPIAVRPGEMMTGLLLRDITPERDLVRRRDTFISVASHELRTPMTTIMGFSELLLRSKPPAAAQRQWLEHIHRDSKRLTAIIDEMLNVSRIQSGTITINAESLRLSEVVEDVLSHVRPTTTKHEFKVAIPPRVSRVVADRDKLIQVLTNLLDNAVKYSPQGGRVTVAACPHRDREQVVVSVADQGVGIAPEDRERVFTTFYRIRRPETESVRGSGLGLYIVKALVELMGGQVWLESEKDKGSTFFFSLPTPRERTVGRGLRQGGGENVAKNPAG